MMPEYAWKALMIVGAVAGVILALVVLMRFLAWLAASLWIVGLHAIEGTTHFLTHAVQMVAIGMWKAITTLFAMIWESVKIGVLGLTAPVKRRIVDLMTALEEHSKLRLLYWKYGSSEFPDFESFRRHMRGEEDEPEREEPGRPPPHEDEAPEADREYSDALELLGIADPVSLTLAVLKKRQRELMSIVHPDKGCPTSALARKVLEAVETIKRRRKWA